VKQGHFHLHTQPVSRTRGHSAVAAAAYQSGQNLTHEQQQQCTVSLDHRKQLNKGRVSGELRDELGAAGIELSEKATAQKEGRREWRISDGDKTYTVKEFEKKVTNKETGKRETVDRALDVYADQSYSYVTREDVVETWIQAGNNAPDWIKNAADKKKNREAFWNAIEEADVARDSKPAQKIQMTLVRELSYEENKALLQEYISEQFISRGYVVDVATHTKEASDGSYNPHAHLLITTRPLTPDGKFAENKPDYLDNPIRVKEWRKAWATKLNGALEANGSDVRVDDRSYKKRGLDIKPGEHMGAAAWNRARRGQPTDKAERNEEIERQNAERDKHWQGLRERMQLRSPEYSAQDEAAYYAKQEREMGATYEPDAATLKAYNQKQDATEKKIEQKPEEKRGHYTGKIVKVGFFGSKTTTIYQPGMASLPKKVRDRLDQQTTRMPPAEVEKRLAEYHARTFPGYVANEQSGGSPRQALEQLQRVAKAVKDKTAEVGQRINERYTSWKNRVSQGQNQKDTERDKDSLER
jgi:MobA/MobL family